MTREVLLVGNDESLLSTRARIIEGSGVGVKLCHPAELAGNDVTGFVLAMLCHSLTPEQVKAAAEYIQQSSPRTRVVKIRSLHNALNQPGSQSINELSPLPEEVVRYVLDMLSKEREDDPYSRRSA